MALIKHSSWSKTQHSKWRYFSRVDLLKTTLIYGASVIQCGKIIFTFPKDCYNILHTKMSLYKKCQTTDVLAAEAASVDCCAW